MSPIKIFMIVWNLMAVLGSLVTLALFGAAIADFSGWVLGALQGLLS